MGTAPSGEVLSHGHGMGSVLSAAHHGLLSEANPFPASCHAVLRLLAGGQGILWAVARKRAAELAPKPKPEPKPEPAPSPDEPASMKASRTSLAELECKLPGLPAETQASVRAIMQSANNILGCMATDPRDVDHGARFLKRYLAATHGIVDTHLRFAHDKDISPDVASALPGATTCSPG